MDPCSTVLRFYPRQRWHFGLPNHSRRLDTIRDVSRSESTARIVYPFVNQRRSFQGSLREGRAAGYAASVHKSVTRAAKRLVEEYGILASPNPEPGSLDPEVAYTVQRSRVTPGEKKDFGS
jgi:hypothetical protein